MNAQENLKNMGFIKSLEKGYFFYFYFFRNTGNKSRIYDKPMASVQHLQAAWWKYRIKLIAYVVCSFFVQVWLYSHSQWLLLLYKKVLFDFAVHWTGVVFVWVVSGGKDSVMYWGWWTACRESWMTVEYVCLYVTWQNLNPSFSTNSYHKKKKRLTTSLSCIIVSKNCD